MSRHRGRSSFVQGNTSTHRTGQTIHRSSRNVSTNPRRSTHPNTGNTRQKSQNNNHRNQSTRRTNPTQPTANNARHTSQNGRPRQNPRNNSQNGSRRRRRTVVGPNGNTVSRSTIQSRVRKRRAAFIEEIPVGIRICNFLIKKWKLEGDNSSLALLQGIINKLESFKSSLLITAEDDENEYLK